MTTPSSHDASEQGDRSLETILTEMVFPADETEPAERTLSRLVTENYRQRVNGKVYSRAHMAAHLTDVRTMLAGGRVELVEGLRDGNRLAARLLFHGKEATFESTVVARLAADGRVASAVEIARPLDGTDDDALL
ncbi:hypothetical protein [Actinoplanes sp. RD1]|uniref:hypothetical protein n=1 Tax=Actinoplanes sp. RD1 TaxID=3064538 RepID=UPI0027411514|nr:hypothetical protein [Actinoplanes sp. RD1]